jgi:hypothetical protein
MEQVRANVRHAQWLALVIPLSEGVGSKMEQVRKEEVKLYEIKMRSKLHESKVQRLVAEPSNHKKS